MPRPFLIICALLTAAACDRGGPPVPTPPEAPFPDAPPPIEPQAADAAMTPTGVHTLSLPIAERGEVMTIAGGPFAPPVDLISCGV